MQHDHKVLLQLFVSIISSCTSIKGVDGGEGRSLRLTSFRFTGIPYVKDISTLCPRYKRDTSDKLNICFILTFLKANLKRTRYDSLKAAPARIEQEETETEGEGDK